MTRVMRMWCFEDRQALFVETFHRTASRSGFDVRLVSPAPNKPIAFEEFCKYYQHLSPNSPGFELACFRRYFEAARQVERNERVIIADSDLLIQLGPRDLPQELLDNSNKVTGSIGKSNGLEETDISPHFSFWTGQQLIDFCDFIIEFYKNRFDCLQNVHRIRMDAGNARASISDMTLFYLWVKGERVPFFDTNCVLTGTYIDHNISMTECRNAKFAAQFGRKAINMRGGRLALRTVDGQHIIPAILHLQGRYKIVAGDLEAKRNLAVSVKSAYIMAGRLARGVFSAVTT